MEDVAADLCALVARRQLRSYEIAHFVKLHPHTVGQRLGGGKRLRPELAKRLRQAIEDATRDREGVEA